MQKISIILSSIVLIGALLTGCAKDPIAGPAGANGKDGNANVASTIFTSQTFAYDSTYKDYVIKLNVQKITQKVVDNGMVDVYFQTALNNNAWVQVPAQIGGVTINVGYSLGAVKLRSDQNLTTKLNIKVVTIE